MKRRLNLKNIERAGKLEEARRKEPRWKSGEHDITVQMSLRMGATAYGKFRELCAQERRTNGDMLEILMDYYFTDRGQRENGETPDQ